MNLQYGLIFCLDFSKQKSRIVGRLNQTVYFWSIKLWTIGYCFNNSFELWLNKNNYDWDNFEIVYCEFIEKPYITQDLNILVIAENYAEEWLLSWCVSRVGDFTFKADFYASPKEDKVGLGLTQSALNHFYQLSQCFKQLRGSTTGTPDLMISKIRVFAKNLSVCFQSR